MKITGWTWYENPDYKELFPIGEESESPYEFQDVVDIVVAELRDKGYKFTGSYHQGGDYGAPIIDGCWIFQCSCRTWGGIMAAAYPDEIDNSDGYGYTLWAWLPPEEMVVPSVYKLTGD